MTAPQDANDLLFGSGGAPSFQWADPNTRQDYGVGTGVEGEIVRTDARQQRDINDKKKMAVWPDGKPKYVAIVTLQTSLRDPTIPEDDGQRSIWISGKYLTDATKAAVRKAGAKELEVGGRLRVTHSGYGKAEGGYRPPRLFEVVYLRPTPEKLAELAARQQQADPWGAVDASDPWGSGPATQPPAQQQRQYDQGGIMPPVQQPPVGGFDGKASPASVAATSGGPVGPEAQALIDRMYAQQQGGAQ